ncbi:unnamed protein product [Meloidogyne enterolobii]|uniref:Uncharacterized protein n=1 Tax=Meloidogyne enterolobii TaxID=390850 RepID=A0ACB0YPP5_MELEN
MKEKKMETRRKGVDLAIRNFVLLLWMLIKGCGKCPRSSTNKIPCRECKTDLCNTEKYFKEVRFCWVRDIAACPLNIWNGFCYYTVRNKKVQQGCGKGPKLEINVLNVHCNGQLCNTKELFDKTFFCLNKGKEEKSLGAVICKERSCLVRRYFDGKLEQGCGKCLKNKTNLSNIQCAQCHKNSFCNTDTFFESQIFCWEKSALNWIKNKGTRVCKVGVCFVGVDKNKMGKFIYLS